MDDLEEATRSLETRMGVREGLIDSLMDEDDWSFVIKSHALLESACTEMLAERVGVAETLDIFSRMELSGHATGKVMFLKAFGLLDAKEKRFISSLSELRNRLVHNAGNTNFTFDGYLKHLDANQKSKFIDNFGYGSFYDNQDNAEISRCRNEIVAKPKFAIWYTLKYILGVLSFKMQTIHTERKTQQLNALIASREIAARAAKKRHH